MADQHIPTDLADDERTVLEAMISGVAGLGGPRSIRPPFRAAWSRLRQRGLICRYWTLSDEGRRALGQVYNETMMEWEYPREDCDAG